MLSLLETKEYNTVCLSNCTLKTIDLLSLIYRGHGKDSFIIFRKKSQNIDTCILQ